MSDSLSQAVADSSVDLPPPSSPLPLLEAGSSSIDESIRVRELTEELSVLRTRLTSTEEQVQFLGDDNAQLQSLLSTAPPLRVSDLSEPSSQTALMAKSLLHQQQQAEKSRASFIVLKTIESANLMFFCSKYASQEDSIVQPSEHISADVRQPLLEEMVAAHLLARDDSFLDMTKERLISIIRSLVIFRRDLTPDKVLDTLAMPETASINRTEIAKFLSSLTEFLQYSPEFFTSLARRTLKNKILSLLGPKDLKRDLKDPKHNDVWIQEDKSIFDFIDYIRDRVNKRLQFYATMEEFNVSIHPVVASAAIVPSNAVANPVPAKNYWETMATDTLAATRCHRCGKLGHTFHTCAAVCSVCTKTKCRCYKKEQVRRYGFSPLSIRASATSFPCRAHKRSPQAQVYALIDTGANALISNDSSVFLSKPLSDNRVILLANSNPSPVTGTGQIGNFNAVLAPSFAKSLVPGKVLTDSSIVILKKDEMFLLSDSTQTTSDVCNIISNDVKFRTPFVVRRENGLYGLSKADFTRLTTLRTDNLYSNSTYFTSNLGKLKDLVRYFHEAWNHASKKDMLSILDNHLFANFPKELTREVVLKYFDDFCHGCKLATIREKPKPSVSFTEYQIGQCCVLDIHDWETPCFSGHTMSMHARDLGSEMSWVFLLKGAANIDDHIRRVISIYKAAGYAMQILRADKQFITSATRDMCLLNNIVVDDDYSVPSEITIQMPGPYEHAQAGDIECHIKIIVEIVKKILYAMILVYEFWGFAVLHTVSTYNNMPSRKIPTQSRLSLWKNSTVQPDLLVAPALPFGTRVIAHIPLKLQNASSLRGTKAIYVGTAPGVKGGILLYDETTKRTRVRVTFKTMGLADELPSPLLEDVNIEVTSDDSYFVDDDEYPSSVSYLHHVPSVFETDTTPHSAAQHTKKKGIIFKYVEPSVCLLPSDVCSSPGSSKDVVSDKYIQQTRSDMSRQSQIKYFQKIGMCFTDTATSQVFKITGVYLCPSSAHVGPRTPLYRLYDVDRFPGGPVSVHDYEHQPCSEVLRSRDVHWLDQVNVAFIESHSAALQFFANQKGVDPDVCDYVSALRAEFTEAPPPKTVHQMRNHHDDGYLASWMREVHGLHSQGMTIPADMPIADIPPELILQLMPIFEKKWVGIDFSKFKCRLVGLGNTWKNTYNVNTSAGMISMDNVKLLLSIAAATDAEILLLDVKEAFLTTRVNRDRKRRSVLDPPPPDQTYYLRRPAGATDDDMPYIMKPKGFIYGHPLANSEFDKDCGDFLDGIGFLPTNYDSKVYTRPRSDGSTVILGRAVDDILVLFKGTPQQKEELLKDLQSFYTMKLTDPATVVLGLEITRDFSSHTIQLRQRGSINSLLHEHLPHWESMDIDSFAMIPAPPPRDLSAHDNNLQTIKCTPLEKTLYLRIFGQLQWITHTAPDFLMAIHDLSYKLNDPSHLDLSRARQVLSCLARIRRLDEDGLTIGGPDGVQLVETVDTSYGMPSTTGFSLHMSTKTGSIMSAVRRHPFTTDSAMASEGIGGHLGAKRIMGLRYFLTELGFPQTYPSEMYMDNQPFLDTIIRGKGCSERSKPILIRYNIVKEAWQQDEIDLRHLRSANMVSDILTKNLAREFWYKLRAVILGNSPFQLND